MQKRRDIKTRLRQRGATQAELARFMTERTGQVVSTKTISRIINEPTRKLSVEEDRAIEAFLGDEADPFIAPAGVYAPPRAASLKIPLYGLVAAAGGDSIAYSSDTVLDELDAPIRNVDAAFRVAGSSMEPRLFAGETVFVKLGMQPARNDDAVIEMKDDTKGVLIKTFVKMADGYFFLRQWNPDREIKLRYDEVRALHAVRLRA